MDLVQLRYFLGVTRCGGFGKAAATLNVTQPALTRQVQLLEQELGTPLLIRHARGVKPTAAGQILVRRAEEILSIARAAREEVLAQRDAVGGELRIGFPPSLYRLLVADIVSRFREKFPSVSLQLTEGFSDKLCDMLLADQLDMALVSNVGSHPQLAMTPLFRESLWLLEPFTADGRTHDRYRFEDIVGLPLMRVCPHDNLCAYLDREAERRGLSLTYSIQAASDFLMKDLVKRGVGVRVSPFSAVRPEIDSGEFHGGRIDDLFISRTIIRRRDREVTRPMSEITDALLGHAEHVWKTFKGDFLPAEGWSRRVKAEARSP